MKEDLGASPDGDRATHERSRVTPSPPAVGIPSAEDIVTAIANVDYWEGNGDALIEYVTNKLLADWQA